MQTISFKLLYCKWLREKNSRQNNSRRTSDITNQCAVETSYSSSMQNILLHTQTHRNSRSVNILSDLRLWLSEMDHSLLPAPIPLYKPLIFYPSFQFLFPPPQPAPILVITGEFDHFQAFKVYNIFYLKYTVSSIRNYAPYFSVTSGFESILSQKNRSSCIFNVWFNLE